MKRKLPLILTVILAVVLIVLAVLIIPRLKPAAETPDPTEPPQAEPTEPPSSEPAQPEPTEEPAEEPLPEEPIIFDDGSIVIVDDPIVGDFAEQAPADQLRDDGGNDAAPAGDGKSNGDGGVVVPGYPLGENDTPVLADPDD